MYIAQGREKELSEIFGGLEVDTILGFTLSSEGCNNMIKITQDLVVNYIDIDITLYIVLTLCLI
jgi:hypothetical protein